MGKRPARTASAFDVEIANRVVPHVLNVRIGLWTLNIERHGFLQENAQLSYKLDCSDSLWTRPDRSTALGALCFNLDLQCRTAESDEVQTFAELEVVYNVLYLLKNDAPGFDDDTLEHYIGLAGSTHAWPYARADIQMACGRLEVPTLTLPLLQHSTVHATFTLRRYEDGEDEDEEDESDG
jgi:hypothetical protein